jgi:septal ring factor EnvC (AmiA/AmiB activator)
LSTKITKAISSLALCVLLLATLSQVGKAEPVYTVSGSELNDMKHYIELIRQENLQLQNDLKNSRISLEQAEERRRNLSRYRKTGQQKVRKANEIERLRTNALNCF